MWSVKYSSMSGDYHYLYCSQRKIDSQYYKLKNYDKDWRIHIMNENAPVFDWEDAVNFITERCEVDRDTVEKVLELEEEYMRNVGIITSE